MLYAVNSSGKKVKYSGRRKPSEKLETSNEKERARSMKLKQRVAAFLAAVFLAAAPATASAVTSQPLRTLTMDTRSYVMAPGDIYDFRAAVSGPGLRQEDVKVYASRDGVSPVARVPGTDKYRITGRRLGVSYVIAEINGVHASIKVTVRKGPTGRGYGEACRSVSIIGYDTEDSQKQSEMRAVWVPYMTLDMSAQSDKSQAAFQKKFDTIVSQAKQSGMNTLIVHVRPFGDALYPSSYFPWSHLLTGMQGKNPGYDPLAYMVKAAHQAGLEFHAWVNPLRIRLTGYPSQLSADNPCQKWLGDSAKSNWTMSLGGELYYNPAYPEVRSYIVEGVKEIVRNYDVDAIHFDDYFYPTTSASIDSVSYQASGTSLPLLEWRTQNINQLVSAAYAGVKSIKPSVQFGISPQAYIQNDLDMGADVYTWGSKTGYVDYLTPQLYVSYENTAMPFTKTAQTWRNLVKNPNIKLYFGLGLYKAGSSVDNGQWLKSNSIIASQIQSGRNIGADGFMLYSWNYLNHPQTQAEMKNVAEVLKQR